jgi:dipeptidase E
MKESGLVALLPSLSDTIWVGVSAGSMVMTPRIGADFVQWPGAPDDRTLGLVDFSIFPHLDVFPENTMADAEKWAAEISGPAYVLDDQSAIRAVDGAAQVVSEGYWRRLPEESPQQMQALARDQITEASPTRKRALRCGSREGRARDGA